MIEDRRGTGLTSWSLVTLLLVVLGAAAGYAIAGPPANPTRADELAARRFADVPTPLPREHRWRPLAVDVERLYGAR